MLPRTEKIVRELHTNMFGKIESLLEVMEAESYTARSYLREAMDYMTHHQIKEKIPPKVWKEWLVHSREYRD